MRTVVVRTVTCSAIAALMAIFASSGIFASGTASAQQGDVQLQMPDHARPRPQGLVPQLQLRQGAVDDVEANDALDDALEDDDWGDDDGWGDDDDWGEGWGDETDGDDALAVPDAHDEGELPAIGEEAHEASHMEAAGPGAEHGEGEHEEGAHADHFDVWSFGASVVNFLIWLAIVVFLGRKPLAEFLRARRLSVEEGLVEAKQLQEAAESKYDEYTERLEHLDDELESLRGEMINAAETERDRIVEEAEARAERMRKDSQFVIDQQMKQLRTDLTREAIEAAVSAAEKVLSEQVQSADQTRLADEYLEGLETSMKDEVRA